MHVWSELVFLEYLSFVNSIKLQKWKDWRKTVQEGVLLAAQKILALAKVGVIEISFSLCTQPRTHVHILLHTHSLPSPVLSCFTFPLKQLQGN